MNFKIILSMCLLALSNSCFSMGMYGSFFSKAGSYARRAGNYVKNNPEKVALGIPVVFTGKVIYENLDIALRPLKYSDLEYESKIDQETCDEISSIRPFIDKRLKKHGLNSSKIKVRFSSSDLPDYATAWNDVIYVYRPDFKIAGFLGKPGDFYISLDVKDNIIEFWRYEDSSEEEKLRKQEEILACIDHEVSHLRRNDPKRELLANSGLAASNFVSMYGFLHGVSHYVPSKKIQAGLVVASLAPLYAVNRILGFAYKRYFEKIADENIVNNRKYLEGFIRRARRSLQFEKAAIEIGLEPDPQSFKRKIDYYWNASYPTWESRIDRLQDLLERLENKK